MDNIDKFYGEFDRIRSKSTNHMPRTPVRHDGTKLKPNQKCPCGSKKKYKACCQRRLESIARQKGSSVLSLNDVADHE